MHRAKLRHSLLSAARLGRLGRACWAARVSTTARGHVDGYGYLRSSVEAAAPGHLGKPCVPWSEGRRGSWRGACECLEPNEPSQQQPSPMQSVNLNTTVNIPPAAAESVCVTATPPMLICHLLFDSDFLGQRQKLQGDDCDARVLVCDRNLIG